MCNTSELTGDEKKQKHSEYLDPTSNAASTPPPTLQPSVLQTDKERTTSVVCYVARTFQGQKKCSLCKLFVMEILHDTIRSLTSQSVR